MLRRRMQRKLRVLASTGRPGLARPAPSRQHRRHRASTRNIAQRALRPRSALVSLTDGARRRRRGGRAGSARRLLTFVRNGEHPVIGATGSRRSSVCRASTVPWCSLAPTLSHTRCWRAGKRLFIAGEEASPTATASVALVVRLTREYAPAAPLRVRSKQAESERRRPAEEQSTRTPAISVARACTTRRSASRCEGNDHTPHQHAARRAATRLVLWVRGAPPPLPSPVAGS